MGGTRRSARWPASKVALVIGGGMLALFVAFMLGRTISLWLLDRLVTDERSGRLVAAVPIGLLTIVATFVAAARVRGRSLRKHRTLRWITAVTAVLVWLPVTALPHRSASTAEEAAFDRRYPGFASTYAIGIVAWMLIFGALFELIARRERGRRDSFGLWPRDPSGEPLDDPAARAKRRSLRRATDTATALLEQRPDIASVDVTWVTGHQHWPVRTVTRDGVEDIDPAQIDTTARQRRRLGKAWARWRVSSGSRPAGRRRRRWRRR